MGLQALTREMRSDERPKLLEHLFALSEDDRRLRFEHLISDDGVRQYVDGIDLSHGVVFVVTDSNLAFVGVAHLARKDGHAELGVSVLPQSRGQGIASALLERCSARARNWGVRVMFMNWSAFRCCSPKAATRSSALVYRARSRFSPRRFGSSS